MRRLTEAARDAHIAGRPAGAMRLLDDALAGSPGPVQRAEIQLVRGRILVLQGRAGHRVHAAGRRSAAHPRDRPRTRSAAMLAEACMNCFLGADVHKAMTTARDACDLAARAGPAVQAFAGVMLAGALVLSGERAQAGALLDRFLPLLRHADPLSEAGELVSIAAQCYFWLDRCDLASDLLTGLTASARKASAPRRCCCRCAAAPNSTCGSGAGRSPRRSLRRRPHLGDEMAHSVFAAYALECLARLAAATGDEQRCRDHAAHALALIDEHHNELGRLYVHSALGLLELGLGRIRTRDPPSRAGPGSGRAARPGRTERRPLAGRPDRGLRARPASPLAHSTRWRRSSARHSARAGVGRSEPPRAVAGCSPPTRRQTPTSPPPSNTSKRRGLPSRSRAPISATASGCDEPAGAPTHAQRYDWQSSDSTSSAPNPGRPARGSSCAPPARRPRRRQRHTDRDQLTAHELQVALIIADGASNREAAAALFLSPKTIEFHLAHIYRKLGVRTRTELAGVAARRGWLAPRFPMVANPKR